MRPDRAYISSTTSSQYLSDGVSDFSGRAGAGTGPDAVSADRDMVALKLLCHQHRTAGIRGQRNATESGRQEASGEVADSHVATAAAVCGGGALLF